MKPRGKKWILPSEGYYRAVEPSDARRNGRKPGELPPPPKGRAGTSPRRTVAAPG